MLLLSLLLNIFPIYLALQISSCIRYETYTATQYRIAPLNFQDSWFSHSFHFSPRRTTKIGFRSKRIFGCCEPGYTYRGFPSYACIPFCSDGCQLDAHCTAPNQCTCDYGYHKSAEGDLCLQNEITTSEKFLKTTTAALTTTSEKYLETTTAALIETTSPKIPCNGTCLSNEICSSNNDVCICQNGFHRSNETLGCVPKCDNGCQNADCTSPNICTCWPHYERASDSSCHLKCTELSCIFGECNKNGTCECAEGFFNNGTNCLWAADDIFSEPDDCGCWSKFMWQTNMTENRCIPSCDDVDDSDCVPFKECEFYEGYTICHAQMYKCIEMPTLSTTVVAYIMADKVFTENIGKSSTEMVVLTVGLITLLLVAVGGLWIWNRRRNWLSQLWSYNTMENTEGEDEQI